MADRTPNHSVRSTNQAPTGADLKPFLDWIRTTLPSAVTTIASNSATLASHTAQLLIHTAQLLLKANKKLGHYSISTSTYTLVASTADAITEFTHASGCTVTVDAGVFTDGQVIQLVGTQGQLTLDEGSGVTIHTSATLLSRDAYSTVALICLNDDGDEFLLTGDLEI